jgi:hypothetical protein
MCSVKQTLSPSANPSNRIASPFLATLHTLAGTLLISAAMIRIDLTGQKFGRLSVVKFSRHDPKVSNIWLCVCACGNYCEKTVGALRTKDNKNQSCGCAVRDSIKKASQVFSENCKKKFHPLRKKIRRVRYNMIERCHNPEHKSYIHYGARGITVCQEWRDSLDVFFNWAINNGCQKDLTIERKNVNGPYHPDNCCFITSFDQQSNTTRTHLLTFRGETMNVTQWSRRTGISQTTMFHRIKRGWSDEKVINTPV